MNKQNHTQIASVIMTVHEMAEYLRLSEAKVYRLAKTGILPAFRVGKSWRFDKSTVDEWIRHEMHIPSFPAEFPMNV